MDQNTINSLYGGCIASNLPSYRRFGRDDTLVDGIYYPLLQGSILLIEDEMTEGYLLREDGKIMKIKLAYHV